MTMSVTVSEKGGASRSGNYWKLAFSFTSAADGTATGTTTGKYTGEVWRAVFVPGTSGDAPTNLLDIQVLDSDSYDILCGQGADLSNAATTTVTASLGAVVYDTLSLSVTNAGDTKKGTLYVYLKP